MFVSELAGHPLRQRERERDDVAGIQLHGDNLGRRIRPEMEYLNAGKEKDIN